MVASKKVFVLLTVECTVVLRAPPARIFPYEMLGKIFDIKQFLGAQPKIFNELKKRTDPDFGFFYWTRVKERYAELRLPLFNPPWGEGIMERLDRISLSRWGDPGVCGQ